MFGNNQYAVQIDKFIAEADFPSQPENLYEPLRYMLAMGGKRIRPQLVLLGAGLFADVDYDKVLPASIAIEYFHNFSLIHDDIMDNAPLRRGEQTVHTKWNQNVGILSGDALLVKAYEQLAKCPVEQIPSLLTIFNKVALEVCEGQQLDIDFEQLNDIDIPTYVNMIRLKTSVLLGGALEMGATIAGANTASCALIYDFGVYLGIAFQLQDDILDAFGDPETFGKQIGGDIIVNKKTVLHIVLKELLSADDRILFNQLILTGDRVPSKKVKQMIALYQKYAVLDKANELKEKYTNLAYQCLAEIDVIEERKNDLYSLADKLMNRKR